VHKKIISGALLVFFVTSMFSSQSAFAGGAGSICTSSGQCSGDGNVCTSATCVGSIPEVCLPEVCIPESGICPGIFCIPEVCTPGACTPATPGICSNLPNLNSCNDGNECTSVDTCLGGSCAGVPNVNSCTDTDNNECTSGVCAATFCVPTPNFNSCDDGLECTFGDTCAATVCVGIPESLGSNCGDAGTQCTNQDTCNLIGQCIDNGQQSDGSSCGSPGDTECSNADTCFNGQCNPNNESGGISCGDTGTACTNQDTCDGSGGCSDNGFASASTSCDADGDQCTGPDACDGSGVCLVGQVIDDIPGCFPVVGGTIIQIESTSLILAGAQSFSWMIPIVLSALGIGLFVVTRKSE